MGKGKAKAQETPRIDPVERSVEERVEALSGESVAKIEYGGVWKGPKSNRYTGGATVNQVKARQHLRDWRMVYTGNFSDTDAIRPAIMALRQLKMEDNARFLSEYNKLEQQFDEKVAKKRAEVAKRRELEQAAVKTQEKADDPKTEDTLVIIEDLIGEARTAAGLNRSPT